MNETESITVLQETVLSPLRPPLCQIRVRKTARYRLYCCLMLARFPIKPEFVVVEIGVEAALGRADDRSPTCDSLKDNRNSGRMAVLGYANERQLRPVKDFDDFRNAVRGANLDTGNALEDARHRGRSDADANVWALRRDHLHGAPISASIVADRSDQVAASLSRLSEGIRIR